MWKKLLIITLFFYFFALLQNSFFTHLNLFGAVPNLVFIFLSLLVFFQKPENIYEMIFFGAAAGIFLDIFSYNYIGPSIISLIIIGFLFKKIQSSLKIREDRHPLVYFLPLFMAAFIVYKVLIDLTIGFDFRFFVGIIYNLIFAVIGFLVFKKYVTEVQN